MPIWVRYALTLFVIGALAGGGLALVEYQTRDRIKQNQQRKLEAAFKEVPGFKSFKRLTPEDAPRKVFELAGEGGGIIGYAAEVACPGSYNGREPIVAVAVTDAGLEKVLLVRTTGNKETPGLGTRVSAPRPPPPLLGPPGPELSDYPFLDQFRNRPVGKLEDYEKGGGKFDAITGATVSSYAILHGVKAAIADIRAVTGRK